VFRPIGASRDVQSDFRTVVATNEQLDHLVTQGRFRADLAHRLSGIVLAVPTLAERVDDIPMLVSHFLNRMRPGGCPIDDDALEILQARPWPGNVRELRQVVEAASVFANGHLGVESLSVALTHRSGGGARNDVDGELVERRELLAALQRASWDTEVVASELGVHRATVYRRVKRLGIELPEL
jgi:transcriptional regulator of acetoin/glycerol metabolism